MTKLVNRVVSIYNRKTSMRLAKEEWTAFDDICRREHLKRKKLLEMIEDNKKQKLGLTCYVRLFTVAYMHQLAKISALKAKAHEGNKEIYQIFDMIA